ncbi:hypothetical protein I2I11_12920 [Pontibacter sp. 172403-2]|uniref:Ig-like domain-containing protein n=1 Tax=Pontibacter rufus TaxID=2791028 RepID=UPI0018AFE6CA|nr:Ig-like domain-containing protein [Pontibacter sp. 172403-2]MBF9254200.1 hypothetical protein [Pontibacter sp. 172403-2]
MSMKAKLAALAAASIMMFTACEDLLEDGTLQPDGSKPSITVNNPVNNQSVTATKGLRVSVTAVDKDEFSDITFVVKGSSGEKSLLDFSKVADKNVLELDTLLPIGNFMPGDYTLSISATDKRTNVMVQDVKFSVR